MLVFLKCWVDKETKDKEGERRGAENFHPWKKGALAVIGCKAAQV